MSNDTYEIMYRPPHMDDHVKLSEALDELFNKLNSIDERLDELERKAITMSYNPTIGPKPNRLFYT